MQAHQHSDNFCRHFVNNTRLSYSRRIYNAYMHRIKLSPFVEVIHDSIGKYICSLPFESGTPRAYTSCDQEGSAKCTVAKRSLRTILAGQCQALLWPWSL